jgi:flagellar hook assembly protein FlgD
LSLRVYNTAGEAVKTLINENLPQPGQMAVTWDGTNQAGSPCASGVYMFYLTEPQEKKTARVLLVR